MPVILKSGLVWSSNLEKVINLMARFCSMKMKRFYISRVGITPYHLHENNHYNIASYLLLFSG